MKHRRLIFSLLTVIAVTSAVYGRGGGGCLREGTPVFTPRGEIAIERLREGDTVYSVVDGKLALGTVRACYRVRGGVYHRLCTAFGSAWATDEHPFLVGSGEFHTALSLCAGQTVYLWRNGSLQPTRLLATEEVASELPAYNLQVFPGQTFIAGGLVVHNKGGFGGGGFHGGGFGGGGFHGGGGGFGGGGYSWHSSGARSRIGWDGLIPWIVIVGFVLVYVYVNWSG